MKATLRSLFPAALSMLLAPAFAEGFDAGNAVQPSQVAPWLLMLLLDDEGPDSPQAPKRLLPIGIPAPEFGIDDSHRIYAEQLFAAGGFHYRDAGSGPYTHYVDNTAPNCSDNNAGGYGTADEPRCSITVRGRFADLPAGSVMEIHGGPYRFDPGWTRMTLNGSKQKPVFVRGVGSGGNKVQLIRNLNGSQSQVNFRLEGQYFVLENLELYQGINPQIRNEIIAEPHHIALRNLEVHGNPDQKVSAGVALSSGAGDDVVIFNNHIHHNIRVDDGDLHGTSAGQGTERVWILNNHIHHNSGDAFQACHHCSVDRGRTPPRFVYIGGNEMHGDRENGIDLKTIRDVVVSQNLIYGYEASTTSNGDAVVVGSTGIGSDLNGAGPDNAWFLFNEITDSDTGVRVEAAFNVTFIGNVIRDNRRHGVNLDIRRGSRSVRMINNSIAGNNEGLHHHWQCGDPLEIEMVGNVYYDHRYFHIAVSTCIAERTTLGNNLFWQVGNPIYFARGFNTYQSGSGPRTPDEIEAQVRSRRFAVSIDNGGALDAQNLNFEGAGNLLADPRFAGAGSLRLLTSSAARDRITEHPVYLEYQSRYGIDIRFDFDRVRRPQGGLWDLGAFEHVEHPVPRD